jgi:hypothetical protein
VHRGKWAIAVLLAGLTTTTMTASASPINQTELGCTPEDSWEEVVLVEESFWQRYSHKGVWDSDTEPPPFPSENWQANVRADVHKVGPEGPYFMSSGGSGRGDWFYLEWNDSVFETIFHEGTVCPEEPVIDPEGPLPEVEPPVTPGEPTGPVTPHVPEEPLVDEDSVESFEVPRVLATTGSTEGAFVIGLGALSLILFGVGALALRRLMGVG